MGSRRVMLFTLAVLSAFLCCCASDTLKGGYTLTSIRKFLDGRGVVGILKVKNSDSSTYGPDITELQITVRFETDDRVRVHLTDSKSPRWEIPSSIIPRDSASLRFRTTEPVNVKQQGEISFAAARLKFSYTSDPFGFAILRQSSGEVLFNSTPPASKNHDGSFSFSSLVFKDQYIEISTQLFPDSALYGLGESTRPDGLRLKTGRVYTLWATDVSSSYTNIDLYGSYPFYLELREGGSGHAVLLLNSNGMDIEYEKSHLTYKVIGGVLDFYFFAGPSPLSVLDQYTQLVGRPAPMPYWSLGFHQCRYGYKDLQELKDVVAGYAAAKIPLETMWSDIDYMFEFMDFTTDPVNYPTSELSAFVDTLHANGQRYVLIVDPGIRLVQNYSALQRGLEQDLFVKNLLGKPYLAQVWPGPVYFPDFVHPKIDDYWTREIAEFHDKIQFDGLWIDMNEASNFCTGQVCFKDPDITCPMLGEQTTCCLVCNSTLPLTSWDNPPYDINCMGTHGKLNYRTIAMSATHYGGAREYDMHNLYGLTEAIATNKALRKVIGKRPFVLSRSSFSGTGSHAAHWTGDNGASWEDLLYSIVSSLNSGIFGVPMVGADICGFLGDTWEELCSRWIQVGAFYPLSRDHNDIHSTSQELYLWDSVAVSARKALAIRYKLLPYYYTLVYEAHVTGAPIMRPLFFEFPNDPKTLDIDSQFLIGNGLLISPVVSSGKTTVEAYFPSGTWYSLQNYSEVIHSEGALFVLPAPADTINLHLRHGSVIPMQEAAMTTSLARQTPFTLLVVFSQKSTDHASGKLFLDDGEQMDMHVEAGKSTFIFFSAVKSGGKGSLEGHVTAGDYALKQNILLGNVVFFGLPKKPTNVKVNGIPTVSPLTASSDSSTLHISNLAICLGENFAISWETSHRLVDFS